MLRSRSPKEHFELQIMNPTSGKSAPSAFCLSMNFLAKVVMASSMLFFSASLEVSQKTTTVGTSWMLPGPLSKLLTGFGCQGSSAPVGSADTAPRPSKVTTLKSESNTTRLGIPETLKAEDRSSFSERCE
eukprot:Skav215584  [mRNA]  locus=scaffold666:68968:71114:- [translate_table: standard]